MILRTFLKPMPFHHVNHSVWLYLWFISVWLNDQCKPGSIADFKNLDPIFRGFLCKDSLKMSFPPKGTIDSPGDFFSLKRMFRWNRNGEILAFQPYRSILSLSLKCKNCSTNSKWFLLIKLAASSERSKIWAHVI